MLAIPILMYHSISTNSTLGFRKFTLRPDQFISHLAYLREQGYQAISVAKLAEIRSQGQRQLLPAKPVVITFDDGFMDFYTTAFPILQEYRFPASLFLVTGYLGRTSLWLRSIREDKRPMITPVHLREMAEAGIDCGSHTHTHIHMDTVTEKRAREELLVSKNILEQFIGRSVTVFAYPYGHYNRKACQLVKEVGFQAACAVKDALSHSKDDLFALARITITNRTDTSVLADLLRHLPFASSKESLLTKGWRRVRCLYSFLVPAS